MHKKQWLTAYWFSRYKGGSSVTPLREVLKDIPSADAKAVSKNMGWLVWTDVFKITLRSVTAAGSTPIGHIYDSSGPPPAVAK